ncbi:hypothetical protein KUTeg_006400 [Tegillarca granosa]|uniref:BHLH domain-containing protein n=1 Tax=Tegillarca granosa TaxID=220873 RepID=A0ABQ9FGD9_TEGGR|nr:hypothetical protein KUTeg_006400 [Tegillarca granosa]
MYNYSVPPVDKNKKRINHNATEKNRKDKIRKWINKIGDLLPPVGAATEKPLGRSTLEIVESAWEYITQLKSTNDRLLVEKGDQVHLEEIERLKMDISNMKMERDRYLDMLKSAGVAPSSWCQKNVAVVEPSVEEVVQNGGTVPVLSDGSMDKDQDLKNKKTKRRNTISLRLENMKKQQQQLQEGQLNINQELSAPGMIGNFSGLSMNNVIMGPNGQQIIGNPNMLMNQMMMGGNQIFGQNPAGIISLPNNQVIGQNQLLPNTDKNAEVAGAGLLQLAMQDAGITPNSNNSNNNSNNNNSSSGANQNSGGHSAEDVSVSAAGTGVNTDNSLQSPKSGDQVVSQPSALQTLASVASNTQNISSTSTVSTASTNNNLLSQNSSAATATTQAINTNPIMATGQNGMQFPGGNGMMNMQFQINGQQCFTGNMLQPGAPALAAPQGQIMFINEQGVPCIANVPLGMDPSIGLQKQIVNNNMLPGQQLTKDLQGNSAMTDQALLANSLAQQQMNMTLQGQLTGMNQQAFQQQQQNAVAMGTGNVMQQAMNNPLAAVGQQFIQPMQGQMQGSTMTQQGIIMPASQVNQSGNLLTVNSVPNQNSQLPQALLLPNGQIIPVVSNPQVFGNTSQTGTMPQQVLQQTGGSVQWQQNPGGTARMALPGLQGKVISQGPDGTSTGNNAIQGQVITSNGQLQVSNSYISYNCYVSIPDS